MGVNFSEEDADRLGVTDVVASADRTKTRTPLTAGTSPIIPSSITIIKEIILCRIMGKEVEVASEEDEARPEEVVVAQELEEPAEAPLNGVTN